MGGARFPFAARVREPALVWGRGLVQKGETANLARTNRNFKGRMGDRDALVYLGSPRGGRGQCPSAGFYFVRQPIFAEARGAGYGNSARRKGKRNRPAR